ncbi:MAG TPA: tetratricopeptide repeat protein [Actinocrinis sp.]|jgi:tetratricopeptide (TPR) repeat protein/DNA-binding SARP family transcriptional activator
MVTTAMFEIRLLGTVEAYHLGRTLQLGGSQQRSILAVLLLHRGQTVPKQRLIEYAWSGDPPATADDLIASYLSRLRRMLAPAGEGIRLLSNRPGFRAEVDQQSVQVDAHYFDHLLQDAVRARDSYENEIATAHLRTALDLWRGNEIALADLESDYLRGQADGLASRRLEAVEMLADLHMGANRPAQAVALLRDLAPAHPEREALTVIYVKALTEIGETVQASQAAARAAEALIERGQDPGPELRQAQTAALAHRPDKPSNRSSPRHQLPADTGAFTGREAEIAQLLEIAGTTAESGDEDTDEPARVAVAAIDGMAGVGKSALAIHVAHRLVQQFPDGQLFIDLHGHTPGYPPRAASETLDTFLRALGVPNEQIPADPEERAAIYRARLAGTRTLILLDNADTESQVRLLIPGTAGCFVLITSRKKLRGLDDAHSLSLDVPPRADCVALFRTVAGPARAGANDPALEEVATLCGDLPLALRIAAALLRYRPSWNAHHLAGRLSDQHHRVAALKDGERDLAAVFDVSFDGLSPAQRRLFRELGLHPGPDIDVFAAAALADTDPHTATSLLDGLVDHNLLSEPVPGRYKLHDLMRIHAYARANADSADGEREAALDRLFDYYLSTAEAADHYLARRTTAYRIPILRPPRHRPNPIDRVEAAEWVRAELTNLAAVADYAAANGRPTYTVALAATLHGHLYVDGPWTYALTLHTAAAKAAAQMGDAFGRATALHGLGRMYRQIGDYPKAAEAHQQALELYRAIDHRLGQANALDSLGRIRWLTGEYPAAIAVFEPALKLYCDVGNRQGQAGALNGLGRIWRLTGDYARAADAHRQARKLNEEDADEIGQATALNDLGRVYCQTGDYPAAVTAQEVALNKFIMTNHRLGQAQALNALGCAHFETGDFSRAAEEQKRALELYREMGHRLGQARALNDSGRVYHHHTGDHTGAIEAHTQALALFREVGDRQGEAEALNCWATVLTATGDPSQARRHHRIALNIARTIALPIDTANALEGIGLSFLHEGQKDLAVSYLNQASEVLQQLATPGLRRIQQLLAEVTEDPACSEKPPG